MLPSALRLNAAALASLLFWTPFHPLVARAQEADPGERAAGFAERLRDTQLEGDSASKQLSEPEDSEHEQREELKQTGIREQEETAGEAEPERVETQTLPAGPAKSGVTPQSITLPKGEGSIQGMGESFTPQLSSGTGTFSVPIALPKGRNGVGPSLALSYGTSSGNGPVGLGWSLGVPFIARQTDRGLPRYRDQAAWHEQEDRFMYSGGQELVPVDSSEATAIDGAPVPAYARGWQQYRSRVEGAFMRFFRAPDSSHWILQSKDGTLFEFGTCAAGLGACATRAVQSDPETPARIFAWQLVRMSDVHGSVVHYRYVEDGGELFLSDIYYDSPASCAVADVAGRRGCPASLADYGRHVRLLYEAREDVATSYVRSWETRSALRLKRIEVTSAQGSVGSRYLVRRYHLGYDPDSFHSLLTSVQVEGRPSRYDAALGVFRGRSDVAEASLGEAVLGELLPPMRFTYTGVKSAGAVRVAGFGALDGTVRRAPASPRHSVDEARTDFFDVNSDGLPDLLVTDPARFDGGAGVYFNGFTGKRPSTPGSFSEPVRVAVPAGLAGVMTLSNVNVLPMDVDGDGRVDLLNMPRQRRYGYFAVSKKPAGARYEPLEGFSFQHVQREVVEGLDVRIDLGRDGRSIKTVDVNHDSLIDVVQTTGSTIHTWLNLGFSPGGDGRFGSARFDGQRWQLSSAPVDTCLPVAGRPLDLADDAVRLADMNGDGLVDIVRIGHGEVVYWPSRGEGAWGLGPHGCGQQNRAARHVTMTNAPRDINVELDGVHLVDVNSDGANDIVQIGATEISVWFNRAGSGFTERAVVGDTPFRVAAIDRVRIADIDGSGTIDIVYGSTSDYRWLDLAGGRRPRLLETVDNGLGALTTLAYGSSAEDYLRDLADATACDPQELHCFTWHREPRATANAAPSCDAKGGGCIHHPAGSPVISTVVRRVTTTDRLDALGLAANVLETRFRYHDAYYEGIEQEFRGFGAADAEVVGDAYEPTSTTRTYFHQGRRPNAMASDRLADNPNEALKGREYLTETRDEHGVYVGSSHTTFAVRRLLTGLDGVSVSYAYPRRTDAYKYDTTSWTASSAYEENASVVREIALPGLTSVQPASPEEGDAPHRVPLRGAAHAHVETTFDEVDHVGHVRRQTAWGSNGRNGAADERITQVSSSLRIDDSGCGGSGWLWRTGSSHLEGHGAEGMQLKRSTFSYNACGDLLLLETPALVPATPRFSFESPPGALSYVQADLTGLSSLRHDVWGQAVENCAGADLRVVAPRDCERYSALLRDASYGAFVESESIAAAPNSAGFTSLVTAAEWDEGLGMADRVTDPNGLVSEVFHDGLGRLTGSVVPNVKGCEGARVPTQRIFYDVTTDAAQRPINRIHTITELSCAGIEHEMQRGYAYVDGLGRSRALLRQGDPSGASSEDGLPHPWIKSAVQPFNRKGKPFAQYETDHYDGGPADYRAVLTPPARKPILHFADAFGRPHRVVERDGLIATEIRHRALSMEVWDTIDLGLEPAAPWCFTGTYGFTATDGHGRTIHQRLQQRHASCNDQPEFHHVFSYYRADGSVTRVVRALAARETARPPEGASTGLTKWAERTFVYDTLGRRIASFDPNTDDPAQADRGKRSWRYLYNRAGDLAAVRDPRGCGQNFFYDYAGRLTGEQYVRCPEAQLQGEAFADTVPAGSLGLTRLTTAANVHVRNYFDAYPAWSTSFGLPADRSGALGRATATVDRGQRTVVAYDDRGFGVFNARQMALLATAGTYVANGAQTGIFPSFVESAQVARPAAFDALHTYVDRALRDHAGRSRSRELPSDPDFVGGAAPRVGGSIEYDGAGRPRRASVLIDGVRHDVVSNVRYTHDQLRTETTYGDTRDGRSATVSTQLYDVRRRPSDMYTLRTPTSSEAQTLSGVSVVTDQRLRWDALNNLVGVHDERPGAEWPDGHRPQTADLARDALHRVEQVDYRYTDDDDLLTPLDDASDWRSTAARHQGADPEKARPAPLLPRATSHRAVQLRYQFDWLANMTSFQDDAGQFYERSLGTIANGADLTTTPLRPSALYVASNLRADTPSDRGGWLEVGYGAGGNVTALTVHAQCVDRAPQVCANPGSTSLDARRNVLRANCSCAAEQHYSYRYDELNRLAEARRFDREAGAWVLKVRQRYRYDAANQRTSKETIDVASGDARVSLIVTTGDFERRGLRTTSSTYQAIPGETETQYLVAGARVVWQTSAAPLTGLDPDHRITFAVTDLVQSTSAVIDLLSGELLEATSFYPNGAREHWLDSSSTSALQVPLEPAGFTGKEGDEEVGLTYFGERYLLPHLGRWASPDPLQTHASGGGEALNAYHYVSGGLLEARDPLGLEWCALDDTGVGSPSVRICFGSASKDEKLARWATFQKGLEDAVDLLNATEAMATGDSMQRDGRVMDARTNTMHRWRSYLTRDDTGQWAPNEKKLPQAFRNLRDADGAGLNRAVRHLRHEDEMRLREARSAIGQFAKAGWVVAWAVALAELGPPKPHPVGGRINVGGTGEIPNVSNLNPVRAGADGKIHNIPNLVKQDGQFIGELFAESSATDIYSQKLVFRYIENWGEFARGAHRVLKDGGRVFMNVWTTSAGERAALEKAFTDAGFRQVAVTNEGAGTMISAVK